MDPTHISDHFEHPGNHVLMGFWVPYSHMLTRGVTLWSYDSPDWGGKCGKCAKKMRKTRILPKKAKKNVEKIRSAFPP